MTATTMFSHALTPGTRTLHAATTPSASRMATAISPLCCSSSRETPLCSRTGRAWSETHAVPGAEVRRRSNAIELSFIKHPPCLNVRMPVPSAPAPARVPRRPD